MAETFVAGELVVPGTYVRVQSEGLLGAAGVSTGNIGVVGTSATGRGETHLLAGYADAQAILGEYDAYDDGGGEQNLTRAAEILYRNGAGAVFARGLDPAAADEDDFVAAFTELAKDDVNILVAPELTTETALGVFGSVLESAEDTGRDMIAVVGADADTVAAIVDQAPADDRIVMVAPGIRAFDAAAGENVALSGTYAAAAVAGLLSTLSPQTSPTNKALPGVVRLADRFSYPELRQLTSGRIMALEERRGVRVVRGLTTDEGAFRQVTTRRIVDFAKAAIRSASAPFVGRLNNERVRKALQGAIDGVLTSMVVDEALTGYELSVTATRAEEIAGRAVVTAVIRPTFSIDFVAVTLVLE